MSIFTEYYKGFQDENPERFNEDIIRLKENDDILTQISDACKSLSIIEGIDFVKAERVSDRIIYKDKEVKNPNEFFEVDYEETRLVNMNLQFRLTKKNEKGADEVEDLNLKLSFPRLLDGYYYYINSVKYYPIYQIIDAETYKAGQSIIMRTSLQPIVVGKKDVQVKVENLDDTFINGYFLYSKIFKVKISIFAYYFAKMGITKTLKFFNLSKTFEIIEKEDVKDFDDYEGYYLFKVGKYLYLKVDDEFIEDENNKVQNTTMLLSFLAAFKASDKLPYEKIDSITYWNKKLGSYFSKNPTNYDNKGTSVMQSFERLLDETTKKLVRINEDDKKNIFTLIRWFLINYNSLLYQNNDDMANKRLRLNESFIFPLLQYWTDGVLRILNGKNVTIKNLKTLFNIPSDFLVKKIVLAENMRYMNNVNTIDLGNKLKLTIAGNQSISNSKGEIRGKTLSPSMLDACIDLVHTSNNDPGTTRMLTPFCTVTDTWHFTEKPNLNTCDYEGDDNFDIDNTEETFDDFLVIDDNSDGFLDLAIN